MLLSRVTWKRRLKSYRHSTAFTSKFEPTTTAVTVERLLNRKFIIEHHYSELFTNNQIIFPVISYLVRFQIHLPVYTTSTATEATDMTIYGLR